MAYFLSLMLLSVVFTVAPTITKAECDLNTCSSIPTSCTSSKDAIDCYGNKLKTQECSTLKEKIDSQLGTHRLYQLLNGCKDCRLTGNEEAETMAKTLEDCVVSYEEGRKYRHTDMKTELALPQGCDIKKCLANIKTSENSCKDLQSSVTCGQDLINNNQQCTTVKEVINQLITYGKLAQEGAKCKAAGLIASLGLCLALSGVTYFLTTFKQSF